MLGDVGHPELVACAPSEGAVDEVERERIGSLEALTPATAYDPAQTGATHDQFDLVPADVDAAAELELGVDADAAVGLPRPKWISVTRSASQA
jgi:hypothetical protein